MQNHPHDSICGCSVDSVHREMIPRFEKADEVGAKYALYGHSHVAKVERLNGVYCINPGSISSSRNEYPESYLVIDTDNNLASYYSRKHQLMDEFSLKE